jgi:hypothetical protein
MVQRFHHKALCKIFQTVNCDSEFLLFLTTFGDISKQYNLWIFACVRVVLNQELCFLEVGNEVPQALLHKALVSLPKVTMQPKIGELRMRLNIAMVLPNCFEDWTNCILLQRLTYQLIFGEI